MMARRVLILSLIATVFGSTMVAAQRGGAGRGAAAVSDAQRKAIQSIVALADDMAAGRPVPNDLGLTWVHDDLLKVQQENQAFVPFTVTVDPSKVTGTVSVYWRVMSKNAAAAEPPPPPTAPAKNDKDKKNDKNAPAPAPLYPYEAISTATIVAGAPARISRSFTTSAGVYDVYVVVTEGSPAAVDGKASKDKEKKDKNEKAAPVQKTAVIKQTITVPDLWNGELNTSSVIVAERLNPLPTPLSAEEKISRPYALGTIEVVPYIRNKFTNKEEIDAFILIYNAKNDSAASAPDVKVEFNFYSKQAGVEKFFNSTLPTNLNKQTLSPQDLAGGQLQAGQAVPLASFPAGDYRLEVKVTDNVAKKEVKREVIFSVTGA